MTSFHAEYKIPGGKLVVVDFDVTDGKIQHFSLSGDFFLEPEEALDDINRAIEGIDADTKSGDIAAAVTAAVPEDTVLYGISAEGVATAIKRAIGGAEGWPDLHWRVVRHDPLPAKVQVALDQVLTDRVGTGKRQPTLRIWNSSDSAIIIGSFQSVKNEVDMPQAEHYGLNVLRRISGGGAMFMESDAIITYSLYLPVDMVKGMSFQDSYAFLDDWTLTALKKIGVEASYQPLNDITSPKGKIGGAAQKRLGNGGMLHHVTMSYDIDAEKMVQVLRIGREKISDKGIVSAVKRVDPLKSQTGLSREDIIQVMIDTFVEVTGAQQDVLTSEELAEATELADTKFTSKEWTYRVP